MRYFSLPILGLFAGAAIELAKVDTGVLPNQTRVEVRLERASATLPATEVQAALGGAIRAWNAALPPTLQLVLVPAASPLPPGEAIILVRFDSDPAHFGGSGADELGDVRRVSNHPKNSVAIAVLLFDKPGSVSTTGKPGTRDLQLVLLHELGHTLGVAHDDNATGVPPIMAPALEENGALLAGGKSLAALRQVTAADKTLLGIALIRRASRDVSGSYTGNLTDGRRLLPIREGEFVVKFEAGKVLLDYKGSKREVPAVDLLNVDFVLLFLDVADGKTLRTMTLKRGNTPAEIEVEAVLQPGAQSYTFRGTLTRK